MVKEWLIIYENIEGEICESEEPPVAIMPNPLSDFPAPYQEEGYVIKFKSGMWLALSCVKEILYRGRLVPMEAFIRRFKARQQMRLPF